MDAKEAIKFLQDNLDARPASEGYLGVSFWRTELEEVIKSLRNQLGWQPMETCPIDEPVLVDIDGEVIVAWRSLAWNNVVQMVFEDGVVYDVDEEIMEWNIDRARGWMPLPEVE